MDIIDQFAKLISFLQNLGYLGIFLISLISSLIPFLPLPYLIFVVLSASKYDNFGLIFLGISAGIGGSIGKLTTYFLGRAGNFALSEERKKELEIFRKLSRKYGFIGVLIFAITPLPDDVLYFPLGLGKFDLRAFLIANLIGKSLLAIFVAYLSKTYYNLARAIAGESLDFMITLIAMIGALILSFILLKIKWSKVVEILQKEGIKGLFKNLKEII